MPLFRSLHNRPFAILLSGQTLSRLGDLIFQISLAWWVLEKTDSALAMGTVEVFLMLPMLAMVLIGGVVVDRLPRAALILATDLVRGVIMIVAAWLAYTGRLEMWMVYLGAFIFGLADAFFQPAYTAIVPQLIPQDDLPSANSLSSLSIQLSRVAGPAIGGLIMASGGASLAFGLNGISFFISSASMLPLLRSIPKFAPADPASPQPASFFEEVRDGWELVLATPILWVTILVAAFINVFLAGPFSVGMPFLVSDFLGGDEKLLGFLLAIFPIGYAISSLTLGNFQRLRFRGLITYGGMALAGLMLAVFGLRVPLWVLVIAALFNGAALEAMTLAWVNLLQEIVPLDKMGRVSSIDMLGSFVFIPLGFALTGWLVDAIGPAPTFLLGGGLAALVATIPLLWGQIRKFD
jgi:MFS family permease